MRTQFWVEDLDRSNGHIAGVDWINLVQAKARWRAAVNTVMNLRVPWKNGNNYCLNVLLFSEEGTSSMELVC